MTAVDDKFYYDYCVAQAKEAKDAAFNSGTLASKIELIDTAQHWTDLAAVSKLKTDA